MHHDGYLEEEEEEYVGRYSIRGLWNVGTAVWGWVCYLINRHNSGEGLGKREVDEWWQPNHQDV